MLDRIRKLEIVIFQAYKADPYETSYIYVQRLLPQWEAELEDLLANLPEPQVQPFALYEQACDDLEEAYEALDSYREERHGVPLKLHDAIRRLKYQLRDWAHWELLQDHCGKSVEIHFDEMAAANGFDDIPF